LAVLRLGRNTVLTTLAAVIACAFVVWAEYGLGLEALIYAGLLMLAGLPVYLWVSFAKSSG